MSSRDLNRVLVTGATGFLGFRVVAALLEAGAKVSALIDPEQENKLIGVADKITILHGDLWNRASLKGQSRGHQAIIHLVGSPKVDPARGITYQQVNLTSTRNAINMAIGDGVRYFTLLSVATIFGVLPQEYVYSKRDAEDYLKCSGLQWQIVRAPHLFMPSLQTPLLSLQAALSQLPPLRWLVRRYAPLSVDIAARGIAAATLQAPEQSERILYASHLQRLARPYAGKPLTIRSEELVEHENAMLDETPFGWLPSRDQRRDTIE